MNLPQPRLGGQGKVCIINVFVSLPPILLPLTLSLSYYRVYSFSGKQVDLLSGRSWEGKLADLGRLEGRLWLSRLHCWLFTPRD